MYKKTLATLGIVLAGGLPTLGVDAVKFNEKTMPDKDIVVAEEMVKTRQVGNVIETEMPWKGEQGLKIKYDMGEPTAAEKLKDKRDKGIITETVDFGDGGFKIDIILDKKPKTNEFCYTIDGYEDYDFFYQPELTQEDIDDGAIRPEEIVGSYAVYHKTLKNHLIGSINYKTGKVMHIPFPYIWEVDDENTRQRAENLTYTDGQLCVVAQQDFLDKANYPVRIDPTFGYTSIGGVTLNIADNLSAPSSHRAFRNSFVVSPTSSGNVTQLNAALFMGSGAADTLDITTFINEVDSGGTGIHDEIGSVERTSVSLSTTSAWFSFTYAGQSVSSGTDYLLGVVGDVADLAANKRASVSADSESGHTRYFETFIDPSSYSNSKEDPWTPLTSTANFRVSIYATYTEPAADTCTYTSGDWEVLYSDNCEISTDVYIDSGSSLEIIRDGAGSFKVTNGANISTAGAVFLKSPENVIINSSSNGIKYIKN